MFEISKIRSVYKSDQCSLLKDFYIPSLKSAVRYDRAVGYFSATMLGYGLQGLDGFIKNDGKMRLIIGENLSDHEYEAVKKGELSKSTSEALLLKWNHIFESAINELMAYRLELLTWLVANGRLEIQYAFRREGMFHDKVGILYDEAGNVLVFHGSANETTKALLPNYNFESIDVYPSWRAEVFNDYGVEHLRTFERLWSNESKDTLVFPIPSEHYDQIKKHHGVKKFNKKSEVEIFDLLNEKIKGKSVDLYPRLPDFLGEEEYKLKEHQAEALREWKAHSGQGIMKLATGAGKTITSIHAAVKLFEAANKLCVVIAVPYQVLADQWCDVLSLFNIEPIRCYRSRKNWQLELENEIGNFNLSQESKRFLAIVVVNATLKKDHFQNLINRIPTSKMLFIGDECHHHGKEKTVVYLPKAKFRIGLSATPWSVREVDEKRVLEGYYGEVIARYTIDMAIHEDVLTGYNYHMHFVYLSGEESEEYERLSVAISKLEAQKENGQSINSDYLTSLYMERSRLLGSMESKFTELKSILSKIKVTPYSLFYCGDGTTELDDDSSNINALTSGERDVTKVAKILDKNHWRNSRFTADVSHKQRKMILSDFKDQLIDAVVAIRVLDEGFDLPDCRVAFLIASSRNERQFIQRRGRILRKAKGKTVSEIHDFIVLPDSYSKGGVFTQLVKHELARVGEFVRVAENKEQCEEKAKGIARQWGIDYDEVKYIYYDQEVTDV